MFSNMWQVKKKLLAFIVNEQNKVPLKISPFFSQSETFEEFYKPSHESILTYTQHTYAQTSILTFVFLQWYHLRDH